MTTLITMMSKSEATATIMMTMVFPPTTPSFPVVALGGPTFVGTESCINFIN